jgi:glycosyltransferase involved in cell wall biosynthesis
MRLAYLMSRHPMASQVFIKREIRGLRACGIEVQPIAVRRASREDLLAPDDVEAYDETLALLPVTLRELIAAHLRALMDPWAYARTLAHAVSRPGPGRLKQFYYFGESMLLLRHLRRTGIAHLHVHFLNNASGIAYLARYFSRLADDVLEGYSLTVHGPTDFWNVDTSRLREKVEAANGVVAISDYARSQVLVHTGWPPATAVSVAHYGVEPVSSPELPDPETPTVLCVGRLAPAKAHSVLLQAISELLRDGCKLQLVIVGDGPLRQFLQSEAERLGIEGHVQLLGTRGSDEVASLYARADIFCLPSFAEGLPVVLMEAMSFGLPVVATRITGVPELITDGESGLLVTPGRVDELAAALRILVLDVGERRRLGAQAKHVVSNGFSGGAASRRLATLLTDFHTTA